MDVSLVDELEVVVLEVSVDVRLVDFVVVIVDSEAVDASWMVVLSLAVLVALVAAAESREARATVDVTLADEVPLELKGFVVASVEAVEVVG